MNASDFTRELDDEHDRRSAGRPVQADWKRDVDRAESRVRLAERFEAERAQDAALAEVARKRSIEVRDRHILQQYEIEGVKPVRLYEGGPFVTLTRLLSLGWTIADAGRDGRVLVAPVGGRSRSDNRGQHE